MEKTAKKIKVVFGFPDRPYAFTLSYFQTFDTRILFNYKIKILIDLFYSFGQYGITQVHNVMSSTVMASESEGVDHFG